MFYLSGMLIFSLNSSAEDRWHAVVIDSSGRTALSSLLFIYETHLFTHSVTKYIFPLLEYGKTFSRFG